MEKKLITFVSCFLVVASLWHNLDAVKYRVINTVPDTPGGKLFDRRIGRYFTIKTMGTINKFIWKLFEQNTPSERRYVPIVTVYISDFNDSSAYTNGNNINISGPIMEQYYFPRNRSRFDFTSVLYHEMAHLFQWHGNYTAPYGLTEGIADYVRVKSDFYDKETYGKPGSGDKWDDGYNVTERFLEYCDSLKPGFTVALNKKMRYAYSDHYFVELLKKTVQQLWCQYKAKYRKIYS